MFIYPDSGNKIRDQIIGEEEVKMTKQTKNDDDYIIIFRPYITVKGKRIYPKKGKKAFPIRIKKAN